MEEAILTYVRQRQAGGYTVTRAELVTIFGYEALPLLETLPGLAITPDGAVFLGA